MQRGTRSTNRDRRSIAGHQLLAGDLTPVFDAILEKALRLCEAAFGNLRVYDGKDFHPGATRGLPPRYAAAKSVRPPRSPSSDWEQKCLTHVAKVSNAARSNYVRH